MMEVGQQPLTGDDLARPAKHLPLKVIRELGRKLHRQLPTSGNWETLAEDLGYGFEEISQFSSLASMRQECTPGETMLLDWVQRGNNCTLFVLRSALNNADRQDCVEYLEQEVYARVICMDLLVCIKNESTKETEHASIRTRSDSCLFDSLRQSLQEPIRDNYVLLDKNASWVNTMAREFKGRELMLLKRSSDIPMEQDPTVDSSSPSLGPLGSEYTKGCGVNDADLSDPRSNYQRSQTDHERLSSQGTTNNLNCVNDYQRSQNHPVNITKDTDVIVNTFENTRESNQSVTKNMSQYSDESNGNYPWSAPDCSNLRDSTRVPSENLDLCELNADCSEYNDPTTLISVTASNKFSHRKLLHGVPLVEYQEQSDQHKEESNTIFCELNGMDHDDPICTNVTEYEDPSVYRPKLAMDDTQEYNYAVDVSIERDDSLTELKRVIQGEISNSNDPVHPKFSEGNSSESSQDVRPVNSDNQAQILLDDGIYNEEIAYTDSDCFSSVDNDRMISNYLSGAKPIKAKGLQSRDENEVVTEPMKVSHDMIYQAELCNDMEDSNYIDSDQTTFDVKQGNNSYRDSQIRRSAMETLSSLKSGAHTPEGAYIDFNKYPQIPTIVSSVPQKLCIPRNTQRVEMRQNREIALEELKNPTSISGEISGDTMKMVRFAGRCVSTVEVGHAEYEMLDRQTSCPNFEYSSSASTRALNSTDFATIAEVFSPTVEKSKFKYVASEVSDKNNDVLETYRESPTFETDRHLHGKRNSYPGTGSNQTISNEKFKFARHSLPVTRNLTERNAPITSRPLPSVPCDSNDVLYPQTSSLRRHSSQLSTRPGSISADNYKTVIGGKSSRPMLDHCLANDHLFTHYNSELRCFRCWSPKETEYTVHKTLGDVKQEDGLYIFWYNRSRKNLIITVTECGELLHFRARTKVLDKQLYHFVSRSKMFLDVQQLLEYHHDNGLYVDRDKKVYMRLPVCVKYDRIPVSV